MKIKIQKRANKCGKKTSYKKNQVVVFTANISVIGIISSVKDQYEKYELLDRKGYSYHILFLRLATLSEKKQLGNRKFAEVEFLEDKPKAVETLKAEIKEWERKNKNQGENFIAQVQYSASLKNDLDTYRTINKNQESEISILKNELSDALEKIDSLGDEIYLFKQTIHQLTK